MTNELTLFYQDIATLLKIARAKTYQAVNSLRFIFRLPETILLSDIFRLFLINTPKPFHCLPRYCLWQASRFRRQNR